MSAHPVSAGPAMRSVIQTIAAIAGALVLGVQGAAQQPQTGAAPPAEPWYGLWAARIEIVNQPPQRALFLLGPRCTAVVHENGTETTLHSRPTFEANTLKTEVLGFATPTRWREEIVMEFAADGNSARGTFTNAGWRDQTGPMTWNRIVPKIDLIATVGHTDSEVIITIRGDRLPYAGPGAILTRCGDVHFDEPDMRFRMAEPLGDKDGRAVNLHVVVGPNVAHGMKNLRLNGVPMRWNYRGPVTLSTVRFVEDTPQGARTLDEVVHTSAFFVEAAYSAVPPGDEVTARLTWPGGTIDVPLRRRTTDVKVFRSRAFEFPTDFVTAAEGTLSASVGDKNASVRLPPNAVIAGLAFRDHLGNILVERLENGVLKPAQIAALEPFTGMVRYDTAPKSDTQTVALHFDGGAAQPVTVTRTTSDPLLYETPSRRVAEPKHTVALAAHGYATALEIVEPRIEVVVRRQADRGTRESVPSLTVDEKFHVDVFVPPQEAAKIGETLVVDFRTKAKGGTASLRLRGQRSQRGHTVYSHSDAVTLEGGGQGEGRTLNWVLDGLTPNGLQNLITGYDMRRLKSEKADVMIVSYGDAKAEVPVYWSWRQKRLAEIDAAMQFLRNFYARGMQTPGVTRDGLEQLTRRLNLIKNYDRIMEYEGEDFNDIQRLLIASAYFDMLGQDPTTWDPDYISVDYRGTTSSRFGVLIGSRMEGEVLNTVVERAKAEYQAAFVRTMRDVTVGMYQFVANASGVNQVLLIATGKDAMNRRVTNMEKWLAGIDLVSQAAMLGADVLKAGEAQRRGAGGLDRARFVTDVRPKMPDNIAADLILGRPPSTAPRVARVTTPNVPADFRDRPTEAITDFRDRPTEPVTDFRERPTEPVTDFRERPTESMTESRTSVTPAPSNPGPVNPAPPVKPAPADAPPPVNTPEPSPGPTVLNPSDRRDLQSAALRSTMERLGVKAHGLDVNADIAVNNGLSRREGAVVLSERYGVPPEKLMKELGLEPSEVARTLDDHYRAGGLADPAKRKALVEKYLGNHTPPDVDAIVTRNTPIAPRKPAPSADPPPSRSGNETVKTDAVITMPDDNKTMKTDRVIAPPVDADPGDPFVARPNAPLPPPRAKRITPARSAGTPPPLFRPGGNNPPQRWRSPDGRTFELEELARGKVADVYDIRNGERAGHVLKSFDDRRTDVKGVEIDADGNNIERHATAREVVHDIVLGAELLEQAKLPHKRVVEAMMEGPNPYIVQERLRPDERIVRGIPALSEGQQRAIVEYHDRLAAAGLMLEDGHADNFYVFKTGEPDTWQAGLLDTDRIARFGQIPSERLAHLLQFPVTGADRVSSLQSREGLLWTPANAREYMTKVLEWKGWIKYQNGEFVPGLLDPKIVREKFNLNVGPPLPPARPGRAPNQAWRGRSAMPGGASRRPCGSGSPKA